MASWALSFWEPQPESGGEEMIYIALGKDVEQNRSNLLWVLREFSGEKICILHVHQFFYEQYGGFGGLQDKERNRNTLQKYLWICGQEDAGAVGLHIEMEDIGKGIVELIRRHSIKKLVMGAAADKHHTWEMTDLKSTKATYVQQHAPPSCHIWFICKGRLIWIRYREDGVDVEGIASSLQASSVTETGSSSVQSHITSLQQRVTELETLYARELRRREEVEETLEEKNEENFNVLDQQLLLKTQVASYEHMMKKLEVERDNAVYELQKTQREEASSSHTRKLYSEYTYLEIQKATNGFSPSLKIGEGGYGSVYKGSLHHTQVAIKVPDTNSLQGPLEFLQEAEILSTVRHPNLVTLMGVCSEKYIIIYEYLPNGSLDDRLSCKNNTPPLTWQNRIRIAHELCSALVFIHSREYVHADFKPANVLFDENLTAKLSDFGISRFLPHMNRENNRTVFHITGPKGTYTYLDPEFAENGELTAKTDTYAFGITQLQLLTGRPALGIKRDVKDALRCGNLSALLDPTAGDWPYVQAVEWARLALRCCEVQRRNRPDLGSVVLMTLERLKRASSPIRLGPEGQSQPPSLFICPIRLEVMQDPHVAADGFTYEAEALREWLDSGRSRITSPMTNVPLENLNLVPNRALRSALQEWQQNH